MEKIEILLATYNGAAFVGQQIDSILAQTNTGWHLTVSDDGSTDGTGRILDDYQERFPDRISRVYSGKKFGNARDHFYWLLENRQADYLFFCDQDDVWAADKVENAVNAIREAERQNGTDCPVLAFTDLTVTDGDLNVLSESMMYLQQQKPLVEDYRELLFKNVVNGNTMAINGSLARLALQCVSTGETIMHDWWIAITAARFGRIVYLPECSVLYRQHGSNSVGARSVRSLGFYVYKLFHLSELFESINGKARQAGVFLRTYGDRLEDEERQVIAAFSRRRMPAAMKWEYLKWLNSVPRKIGFFLLW